MHRDLKTTRRAPSRWRFQEKAIYYKEYTVITPGSPDRGARRIVGGADGELYYTEDHYASFREVIR